MQKVKPRSLVTVQYGRDYIILPIRCQQQLCF